jgi:hypothetical protein
MASSLIMVTMLLALIGSSMAMEKTLIRREQQKQEKEVSFHSDGSTTEAPEGNSNNPIPADLAPSLPFVTDFTERKAANAYFKLGTAGNPVCAVHAKMTGNPKGCETAAGRLQLENPNKKFDWIGELSETDDYRKFPLGCFAMPCDHSSHPATETTNTCTCNGDNTRKCLFHNPDPVFARPDDYSGGSVQTVCHVHEFVEATNCADNPGYVSLDDGLAPSADAENDFARCKRAAPLLLNGMGNPFRNDVTAQSYDQNLDEQVAETLASQIELYNKHPKGCYAKYDSNDLGAHDHEKIFFNVQPATVSASPTTPGQHKHICQYGDAH